MLTRRAALASGLALAACGTRGDPDQAARVEAFMRRLEERLGEGARLGVAALDTGSGAWISYRAGERFAMASTFKWLLAACAMEQVDHARHISLSDKLIVAWSPITSERISTGMSVIELCHAAVVASDNTAANALLDEVRGPEGFTDWLFNNVSSNIRLDRREPELNENAAGDERDTTTPAAMTAGMRRLLIGDQLRRANRERLIAWMIESRTGLERLRAGFPSNWRVGDKTGAGMNGAVNDVAIAWPAEKRHPLLLSVYQDRGDADAATRNAVHAEVARTIVDWL